MKTFIVTIRTANGRRQFTALARSSTDALIAMVENFHGQSASVTVRPGVAK